MSILRILQPLRESQYEHRENKESVQRTFFQAWAQHIVVFGK